MASDSANTVHWLSGRPHSLPPTAWTPKRRWPTSSRSTSPIRLPSTPPPPPTISIVEPSRSIFPMDSRPTVVMDFDDLCDDHDPLDLLLTLKENDAAFKVTLFAIPARCSSALLQRYHPHRSWID